MMGATGNLLFTLFVNRSAGLLQRGMRGIGAFVI